MMKHTLLLTIVLLIVSGCFNERGISMRYYNDCEEYYDAQGYYHKKCGENLLDYKDTQKIYDNVKESITPEDTSPKGLGKVW